MSSGRTSARPSAVAAGALLASAALSAASRDPSAGKPLAVIGRPVPDLCPIHRATGHRCPGCGMTRAFVLLWRGRLREAVLSNPASPFLFATLVWLAIEPIRRRARQQLFPVSVPPTTQQEQ